MNVSIKIIGFTLVLSLSAIATVKPGALSFVIMMPYGDKIALFILFGLLGLLCMLHAFKSDPVCIWPGLFLTVCFAIGDELLQIFFPHRSFSLFDLLANLTGILVFAAATNSIACSKNNHKKG